MDVKKAIGAVVGLAVAGYGVYKIATGEPQKYSDKWFDTVSDAVLKVFT